MKRAALAFALALLCCRTAPAPLDGAILEQLRQRPDAYLAGHIAQLSDSALLDNRDFTYSIAFSRDGRQVAFSHLAAHVYQVGVWQVGPPAAKRVNFDTNPNEFDVEAVDFSPDGATVVTVARDGVVRLFGAGDGLPQGAWPTDEPLVSVAFHPNGRYLVAGSSKGLLTVLSWPALGYVAELRAHEGEVRALAFADDGTLFSGSWDKTIVPFDLREEQAVTSEVRVRADRRGSVPALRASVNGKASAALGLDERTPYVVINSALAKTAGIDTAFLADTVSIPGPLGTQVARVFRNATLTFKSLDVKGIDLAVCDSCVPAGVQGVLGAPFFQKVTVAFDAQTEEARLTSKEPAAEQRATVTLSPRARLSFPYFVNDVSVDRAGGRLGVAFSEVPAQRNREIYEREKKKLVEPFAPGNMAAIVDARSGQVLKSWTPHFGVVSTVGISPDGARVASGGWDKQLFVLQPEDDKPRAQRSFGWSVRRARFSRDGRYLAVAAWTPQNATGDQTSDPSAVLYEVRYDGAQVRTP